MTAPWPVVVLGDVLCHRKEFIEISNLETYKRCRVQLHARGIVLRDVIPGVEIKTKKQQVCRAGEFLVAEIDAKVGGFGIVPEALENAIVSSHYFLFELDDQKLDRQFLDYYIRTHDFRDQVAAQGSTNYAAIRPAHVLGYTVPLPSKTEQRRIVARIEALAGRIEEAKRLLHNSIDEIGTFASSLHLHIAEARKEPIDAFLELHEDKVAVTIGHSYPQVGVKGFGQGLFPKESVGADQTTYKTFNRLFAGAVVLSQVKGWEGAIAVCPRELTGRFASPEYRTFRCVEGRADPNYLSALFATPWFWRQLKDVTRGVGARRERIRPEHFLHLKMQMPSLDAQRKAVMIFAQMQKARPIQAETVAELDALLPAILDKAFKGEL